MRKEMLDYAHQFIENCQAEQHASNTIEFLVQKDDGTFEYRKTFPYVTDRIQMLIVVHNYSDRSTGWGGGTYYRHDAKSVCFTDETDSESFVYCNWTISIQGKLFIWNHGDWYTMCLSKAQRKQKLYFRSLSSMINNWYIVEKIVSSVDSEQLASQFEPLINNGTLIIESDSSYRILS